MSLTFTQIKEKIRRTTGTNSATYTDAQIADDVNLALDEVFLIALKNNGWNVDDWNHPKDPFITAPLVSGRRDYHFTYDEQGNMVLDFYKVMVRQSATGHYVELKPVDQQSDGPSTYYDGQNTSGIPTTYDKTGNGIFLDVIPNYDSTDGLKIFINRTPNYFISTDTTKVAGIDGLCHEYLCIKPEYEYARDKNLPNREALYRDLLEAKKKVDIRYGTRAKDEIRRMMPMAQNNK